MFSSVDLTDRALASSKSTKVGIVMMLWFGLLLALGVTVTSLKGNAPFEREKEVYHIYSLLMTNPRSSFEADCNSRFLISATARVENEQPCVRPPKGRKAEFAEVLADFKIRRAATRVLKRQLSLRKPYELLTDEQVKAFETDRGWSKPEDREPDFRFKGVMEVFTLSDVYFNKNGRLALTAISSWCGSLCAYHQWKVLEKLPTGEWQELPSWVSCFTIAHCLQPSFVAELGIAVKQPVVAHPSLHACRPHWLRGCLRS
jgi:hypothetical protein